MNSTGDEGSAVKIGDNLSSPSSSSSSASSPSESSISSAISSSSAASSSSATSPADIATRIDAIHFDGIDRTKHDILRSLVKPILQTANLAQAIERTHAARERFRELGLFRNVQVSIEEAANSVSVADDRTNLSITFDVEETRRYGGAIFTSASNNDASLTLQLRSPNLFGRGEEIQGRYEHSWKYFATWSASFTKPLILSAFWPSKSSQFDITALQAWKESPWSNYRQLDRGFLADLSIAQDDRNHHLVRWESTWRYLSFASISPMPSFKIQQQFGHSLKSSISHVYTHDRRDHAVLPTSGFMFRLLNEFAGFHTGGVSFLKQEVEAQHNFSLFRKSLILQSSLKFGILKPIENVLVADKFFLGGPLNLRGFAMNGIGPHDDQCAIGSNAYWVSGLHCYLPLPFRNALNECLRVHTFVNAGNIGDAVRPQLATENVRTSAGIGLTMSFSEKVRLEISYCVPLRTCPGDKASRGLQFGIGVNYT